MEAFNGKTPVEHDKPAMLINQNTTVLPAGLYAKYDTGAVKPAFVRIGERKPSSPVPRRSSHRMIWAYCVTGFIKQNLANPDFSQQRKDHIGESGTKDFFIELIRQGLIRMVVMREDGLELDVHDAQRHEKDPYFKGLFSAMDNGALLAIVAAADRDWEKVLSS